MISVCISPTLVVNCLASRSNLWDSRGSSEYIMQFMFSGVGPKTNGACQEKTPTGPGFMHAAQEKTMHVCNINRADNSDI